MAAHEASTLLMLVQLPTATRHSPHAGSGVSGVTIATLLTAIASMLTVVVGGAALYFEGRRDRLSIGINNLWRLIEEWDSSQMRWRRSRLAQVLSKDASKRMVVSDDAIDVLNTFELLGYLVRRSKTLRLEDAWVNFSPWALSWWAIYADAIQRMQAEDSTLFEDFAALVRSFQKYEARRRALEPAAVLPSGTMLDGFLRSESELRWRLPPQEAELSDVRFRDWLVARWTRRAALSEQ